MIEEDINTTPIKNRVMAMTFNDNSITEENEIIDMKSPNISLVSLKPNKLAMKLPHSSGKNTAVTKSMNFVHPAHQNFNMVLNIMIGIKKSVDASLDIPMYYPTEKDYKIKCMYEIAPYRT